MARQSLTDKYDMLEVAIRVRIAADLIDKGIESENCSDLVLKVKDEQMFNLEGGRWLVEIGAKHLIDNDGHSYHHSVLDARKLCEAVDNAYTRKEFKKLKKS